MESVNIISFVFLLLSIPLGMFLTGIYSYRKGTYIPAIFTKFLGAAFIHSILSFILWFVIFQVNFVVVSGRHTGQEKIAAQTIGLLTLIIYGFIGWLLISLVGGKFVKAMSDFGFSKTR